MNRVTRSRFAPHVVALAIALLLPLVIAAQESEDDAETLPSEGFQVMSQAELLGIEDGSTDDGPQDGTFAVPDPPTSKAPVTPANSAAAQAAAARKQRAAERQAQARAARRDAEERAAEWVRRRGEDDSAEPGAAGQASRPTGEEPFEATAPTPDSVPWWYELPLATRRDLPEIDLTVHYYSADPSLRFVKLNGERYGEGDDVDGPLKVREIRRQGVVLQFRSSLFLFANHPG